MLVCRCILEVFACSLGLRQHWRVPEKVNQWSYRSECFQKHHTALPHHQLVQSQHWHQIPDSFHLRFKTRFLKRRRKHRQFKKVLNILNRSTKDPVLSKRQDFQRKRKLKVKFWWQSSNFIGGAGVIWDVLPVFPVSNNWGHFHTQYRCINQTVQDVLACCDARTTKKTARRIGIKSFPPQIHWNPRWGNCIRHGSNCGTRVSKRSARFCWARRKR